ncbi:MAG: DUF4145 domain-containing protein [Rhodoferax sp.]|uniref:DUF4145 domain-containing protein n=1 Tax=Rhodoferax sp. TaxID=50421 RepID=UPI0017FD8182|nr:DUF4145 domain-containing protein [Rhodoferax sp.]NMM19014.1 DUF4145 domain-containing protein [Rhodoferax sp.]
MYTQTLASYAGDASIIASIGLRATIEAVCNHLKISGTSLEKRIDLLFKNGSISSSDKKRLHAIRFLGNDAAHEILEPKETELRVAFEIIEHLINSVFILEYRAKRLDIPVDTYAEFLSLVEDCAGNSTAQSAESLPSILGRHRRRLGSELLEFETRLGSQITAGEIAFLKLDSVQTIDGKAVQLYLVDHEALTDDIPF